MDVAALTLLVSLCAPQVHSETMLRVITHESGANSNAIGINGGLKVSPPPATKPQATAMAKMLINAGYNIDMGLMQINVFTARRLGLSVDQLFDPCSNVKAGAQVLTENYARTVAKYGHTDAAYFAALSIYNTGNSERGINNGYVAKVLSARPKN